MALCSCKLRIASENRRKLFLSLDHSLATEKKKSQLQIFIKLCILLISTVFNEKAGYCVFLWMLIPL